MDMGAESGGNDTPAVVPAKSPAPTQMTYPESDTYGKIRRTTLTEALRRSTDILDLGARRVQQP